MCYTWEILRISCTQAFHVTYCYYYFIVLPRPYSPPQSDGEFFASHFIKTPSAESYTFLLTWLLFTCTLFTSMQKPFAGYQQSLSSGPTKFKHFSANASSSYYMQYRILLHFLFEIPTGSQTTPFETVRYPVALTYPPNSRSFNPCPVTNCSCGQRILSSFCSISKHLFKYSSSFFFPSYLTCTFKL